MPGLLGDAKGPIDAAREFHGSRPPHRRTYGTPQRTQAMAVLDTFRRDLDALAMCYATCNLCHGPWPCKAPCKERLEIRGKETIRLGPNPVPDPDFQMPDLDELRIFLADAWAGHMGQDTRDAIEMVEAATNVRTNPMVNGNAPDGSTG